MKKFGMIKVVSVLILVIGVFLMPGIKLFDSPIMGADNAFAFWPNFGRDNNDIRSVVENIEPKDKLVTYSDNIEVKTPNGESYTASLRNVGKNSFTVNIAMENGKRAKVLRRVLKLPTFRDVENSHWAKKRIEAVVASGLIDTGRSVYFRPEGTMSRANFARSIARAVGVNPVRTNDSIAGDVNTENASARYIRWAVRTRRIMDLDDNGDFRPDDRITKAEAIAAICRMEGIAEDWNMYESPFADLHPRHKYARFISAAKNAEILGFAEERGLIDADGLLTNAELAYLLTETSMGKKAVAELVDWNVGYNIPEGVTVALSELK